jgi:hypothetical protein
MTFSGAKAGVSTKKFRASVRETPNSKYPLNLCFIIKNVIGGRLVTCRRDPTDDEDEPTLICYAITDSQDFEQEIEDIINKELARC